MFSVSAGFKTKADDPQNIEEREFHFNGTDYSDKLLDMGNFSQRAFEGDPPDSVDLVVTVLNDAGEFNFLNTTKTNLTKAGQLKVGYAGELINRYEGKLDRVEFSADRRPFARLTFRTRVGEILQKTIGSEPTPVLYTSSNYNPMDLAWDILTNYAGLDNTASAANVDIDYDSWAKTKTLHTALAFEVKARYTGQTVADAISQIADLTDTVIYGEADGKIVFKKYVPEVTAGGFYEFDSQNADIQTARMGFDRKKRIINKAVVSYGYNPSTQIWAGVVTVEDTTSQTNFGLNSRVFQNVNVWHETQLSATSHADHIVYRYADPAEEIVFDTKRGTQALIHQIGDVIEVTWPDRSYTNKKFRIYGLTGQLSEGKYQVTAEVFDKLTLGNYFILDDATNGLLDNNILF